MSTSIPLLDGERIQFEGIFDLKELYKHIHDWLEWRKYEIAEKKYSEKVKPTGKELELVWSATRQIDEYSQFEIEIKWQVFGLIDVEVQKDKAKVKMNKGEVNLFISAWLVLDWRDVWETSGILKFLKAFYEKYLYFSTTEKLKGQLWGEGWDLFNEVKAFLHLYRFG